MCGPRDVKDENAANEGRYGTKEFKLGVEFGVPWKLVCGG
jgi:hypothetical protein